MSSHGPMVARTGGRLSFGGYLSFDGYLSLAGLMPIPAELIFHLYQRVIVISQSSHPDKEHYLHIF
jgi:hypothetical protein